MELDVVDTDPGAVADRLASASASVSVSVSALVDGRVAGVLSLLALDERPHPEHSAVPVGLALTGVLAEAVARWGEDGSARLWCVTRARSRLVVRIGWRVSLRRRSGAMAGLSLLNSLSAGGV
ncbi:hypothetical protein R8789_30300 [Streptomyces malaysiensis]|nr:hypothetical protein R8789_30300 [Streptomyces malaysiensis]